MQNYLNRIPNYVMLAWLRILFKSANENILLRLDSFEKPYKQLELVSHRISKHEKTMYENTRASRSCRKQCMKTLALRARAFIHCFFVFGYPGETLALVVHILLHKARCPQGMLVLVVIARENFVSGHFELLTTKTSIPCGHQAL